MQLFTHVVSFYSDVQLKSTIIYTMTKKSNFSALPILSFKTGFVENLIFLISVTKGSPRLSLNLQASRSFLYRYVFEL